MTDYKSITENLENAGYRFSRWSLYNGYRYAGTVTELKNGDKRVHHGITRNMRMHGYSFSFQVTEIYTKA